MSINPPNMYFGGAMAPPVPPASPPLNSKGSSLCDVNGWIANRHEYLGSLFSPMSVSFAVFFMTGPK